MQTGEAEVKTKIIDEVRSITARVVAKNQDAAKVKYPMVLEQIKAAAKQGKHSVLLSTADVNEYTKRLLEADGFTVCHTPKQFSPDDYKYQMWPTATTYEWTVSW